MNTQILEQVRQLSADAQIELVQTIWDDLANRNAVPPVTEAQMEELDRRLADHEAHPDDVIPWSEVKASALARKVDETSDEPTGDAEWRLGAYQQFLRDDAPENAIFSPDS